MHDVWGACAPLGQCLSHAPTHGRIGSEGRFRWHAVARETRDRCLSVYELLTTDRATTKACNNSRNHRVPSRANMIPAYTRRRTPPTRGCRTSKRGTAAWRSRPNICFVPGSVPHSRHHPSRGKHPLAPDCSQPKGTTPPSRSVIRSQDHCATATAQRFGRNPHSHL